MENRSEREAELLIQLYKYKYYLLALVSINIMVYGGVMLISAFHLSSLTYVMAGLLLAHLPIMYRLVRVRKY